MISQWRALCSNPALWINNVEWIQTEWCQTRFSAKISEDVVLQWCFTHVRHWIICDEKFKPETNDILILFDNLIEMDYRNDASIHVRLLK